MRRGALCVWTACALWCGGSRAWAADNIVMSAADVTTIRGSWTRVADPSAANGQTMASADLGWSALDAPLASPAHFFEIPFSATANTPYRVWVRLRAANNSKWNDSVWVQFSDSLTTANAAVYRIGTASALLVNLESCTACGVANWGWQDGAWWLSQSTTVQFPSTGTRTLRIQTREDGVQVDQIVLSPTTYLTVRPGQLTNDSTIVPAPAATSTPYAGTPAAVPGTIQAENFDNGGEGVAYHDTTAGNSGGAFRSTGVDLEVASGGGYDVGWVDPGEWLKYTVSVASAGTYAVQVRVAAAGQGGTFHLEMNGANVTGALTVPATGGWQNWQTVTRTVTLAAGTQVLRLVADTVGTVVGNFDSIAFTATAAAGTPYSGRAFAVPGTVEAEQFDNGGEGIAYHDTSSGNSGGAFRSTNVDLEPASGGGYDVGWIDPGEWLQYSVDVASAGSYTVQFRVAAAATGGTFHLEMNGTNVTGTLAISNTGGWQNWQTVTQTVALAAGPQSARIVFDSATAGIVGNLDRFEFIAAATPTPPSGSTITVPAGGNLQAAIDSAGPGDTILLAPGATYLGGFLLPAKSGASYITIRSAAADSALPADGVRVGPQNAAQLPRIQGGQSGAPAFSTEPGAHHWRLQFLELVDTWAHGNIVELGDGSSLQNSLTVIAHDLIIDRCYIHGDPTSGQKRGIALNSASTSIINSYISNIKSNQEDSQAIAAWNGPGPYSIVNNYLEASGENVMFGGADPAVPNLVPSDIVMRHNQIAKQPSWRGQAWTVKNLIELKSARRVVIDGNILEYNWAAAQSGYAIVLTPRNQDGGAPWTVVQQVQVTNNVIRHVSSGFNILGTDYTHPSGPLKDILIRNNLVLDMSRANWGGSGQFVLTQGGSNITVDHNTIFTDGTSVLLADVTTVSGFVFTNNIVPDNSWAVMGSGAAPGNGTIAIYYPGSTFRGNVFIGSNAATYPAGNFYPSVIGQVGFVDPSANFRLAAASLYVTSATDGTAVGANIPAINAAAGTNY
jgi:carbohydrate binding protein with CBM6 domain